MEDPRVKARIRLEYKVEYQDPIQVEAGETVEVGRADDDYPGWLWCRAADGREGWMPLELQPGDEVEIEEVSHGWALVRNAQGERGWIPKSHIVM